MKVKVINTCKRAKFICIYSFAKNTVVLPLNGFFQLFNIHSQAPDKIQVKLDDTVRPAFRVCWGDNDTEGFLDKLSLDVTHFGGARCC